MDKLGKNQTGMKITHRSPPPVDLEEVERQNSEMFNLLVDRVRDVQRLETILDILNVVLISRDEGYVIDDEIIKRIQARMDSPNVSLSGPVF